MEWLCEYSWSSNLSDNFFFASHHAHHSHSWFSPSPPKLSAIDCLPWTGYLEHADIYLSQFPWICFTMKELTGYTPNSKYSSDCGILCKRFRASGCRLRCLQTAVPVQFFYSGVWLSASFLHRQQWMFENYLDTTWLSLSVSSFFQFFWVTNNFHFFSITTWLVNFRVLRISIPVRINYSRIDKLVCLWIKYVYCFFFFPLYFSWWNFLSYPFKSLHHPSSLIPVWLSFY